jgi:drug/metabolite transporter (DMT)-like permease
MFSIDRSRVQPRATVWPLVLSVGVSLLLAGIVTHYLLSVMGAILFLVGSTLASSLYQLLSRRLATQDNPATSATITTIVGAAPLTLAVPFVWVTPVDPVEIALFLSLGILAGIGHYALTVAYQRGPAAVIAPFNYSSLIWATLLGYLIFDDFPDAWTWIGATVIIGAGLYIAHRESVRWRRD